MSTSPEQFTGTPLVAGDVLGVRAWDVDSLGRIKSPQFSHIWTPGENVAACQKGRATGIQWGYSMSLSYFRGGVVPTLPTMPSRTGYASSHPTWAKVDKWVRRNYGDCRLLDVEFDHSSNMYKAQVICERDRSGKRIKRPYPDVIAIPAEVVDADEAPHPEPPPEPAHDFATCTCGFYAYLNGTNDYADHHVIGVVRGYGETFLGTRGFRSSKAKIVAAYASTHADVERVRPLPVSRDRMRELYPDVAWFDDYAAMVAEFPPSDPEPTPTTDPDFWTRSA